MDALTIPGYRYGDLPRSPVTPEGLERLKATVLWTDEDERALRQAGAVLADQVDDILDVWYGFVAATAHLLAHFTDPAGQPIESYLSRVRDRFRQWIHDTCRRPLDQAWLDYQHEIAQRHHSMKNRADEVQSTPLIPARYLIAFIYPLTATMRPFLAKGAADGTQVDVMHEAWFKAVTMTAALWSQPHADADW